MSEAIDVDLWVRGSTHATTRRITAVPPLASTWTDDDVRRLLSEMLLALEREKNPGGLPPPISFRGFSWIVSGYERGGVVLHLDLLMGTASAGPFAIDEQRLTELVSRVIAKGEHADSVH